jgi:hypothetical protein
VSRANDEISESPGGREHQLDEAFGSFRDALREILTAEAQRSVDGTIQRLSRQVGTFQVEGVDVQVVIRDLRIATGDSTHVSPRTPARRPGPAQRPKKRAAKPTGRRGGGRPVGPVRLALLAAIEADRRDQTVEQLRERLEAQGVAASIANVHQQLRRLVQGGQVVRAGRGVYRAA